MNFDYEDIRSRITEMPQWFDENAVPRYCAFAPGECANIYAQQAVLLSIRCQSCAHLFDVCISWSSMDAVLREAHPLDQQIRDGSIHYGDPPNVGCCPAGATENSEPIRVIEFWRHDERDEWVRDASLEVHLDDDVADCGYRQSQVGDGSEFPVHEPRSQSYFERLFGDGEPDVPTSVCRWLRDDMVRESDGGALLTAEEIAGLADLISAIASKDKS